jgi:hypothetical protein
MSSIGSTSIAALGFAGSIVGSSQPEAAVDQSKAASAEQKARTDQKDLAAQALDGILDPEFGTDRDADGRLLYRRSPQPAPNGNGNGDEGESSNPQETAPRPADALGESGKSLDIDA